MQVTCQIRKIIQMVRNKHICNLRAMSAKVAKWYASCYHSAMYRLFGLRHRASIRPKRYPFVCVTCCRRFRTDPRRGVIVPCCGTDRRIREAGFCINRTDIVRLRDVGYGVTINRLERQAGSWSGRFLRGGAYAYIEHVDNPRTAFPRFVVSRRNKHIQSCPRSPDRQLKTNPNIRGRGLAQWNYPFKIWAAAFIIAAVVVGVPVASGQTAEQLLADIKAINTEIETWTMMTAGNVASLEWTISPTLSEIETWTMMTAGNVASLEWTISPILSDIKTWTEATAGNVAALGPTLSQIETWTMMTSGNVAALQEPTDAIAANTGDIRNESIAQTSLQGSILHELQNWQWPDMPWEVFGSVSIIGQVETDIDMPDDYLKRTDTIDDGEWSGAAEDAVARFDPAVADAEDAADLVFDAQEETYTVQDDVLSSESELDSGVSMRQEKIESGWGILAGITSAYTALADLGELFEPGGTWYIIYAHSYVLAGEPWPAEDWSIDLGAEPYPTLQLASAGIFGAGWVIMGLVCAFFMVKTVIIKN